MARNVGSIEVTVDANTGKLTAQARKDGKIAGSVWASAFEDELGDVSGRELLNRLKMIRKQAEATLTEIDVDIGIDDASARAGIKKLEGQLRAAQLELIVNGNLDSTQLEADIAKARTMLRDIRLDVEGNLDVNSVIAINNMVNTLLTDAEVDVEANVDKSSFAQAKAWIINWADDAGSDAGKSFGGGFSGDDTKMIIAAVLAMGDALAAGLSGVLAAGTAVISSAIQAMGAAAGAAVPIFVGFGAAMAAGIVGAMGFKDAMDAVSEEFKAAAEEGRPMNMALLESSAAFKNLAPSARDAARAFAEVRDDLGQLQKEVQADLFRGFGDEIRSMASETIPDLSSALQIAAGSLNEFGKDMAAVARQTDFTAMMEAIDPALDDAFDGATALAGTLEPFLRAAGPAAERLAEMFERGAESLQAWVRNNPTEIADFLDDGLTSLQRWVDLLESTGDLLATVFKAGAKSGDSFVVSLNNIIERFDGWLESAAGQDALSEFFESGQDAMKALEPVLDGLKEAFSILITPETMGRFEQLGQAIGDALPIVAQLISLFGQLGTISAISNILTAIGPLVSMLASIPGPVLEIIGTFGVLLSVGLKLAPMIKAVQVALMGLTTANVVLLALTAAVAVAMVAFDAFKGKSAEAAERTKELTTALQNNVDAMISSGEAAGQAGVGMDALNKTIMETGDDGKKLQQAFADINAGAGDATLGIEDTTRVLAKLHDGGEPAAEMLRELATGYGLPAGPAKELADIVNSTDDNFTKAQTTGTALGMELEALAESAGIPVEELIKLAQSMEETQDQGEKTDLTKITDEFNRIASTGTEAEQAMLKEAQATAASMDKAGDAVTIYEAYTDALNESANAADDSASATESQASSYELIQQSIDDAAAAHKAESEALKAEQAAAMDAYQAQQRLGEATERAASSLAQGMGVSQEFADGIVRIGEAARDAAAEADALTSALDLLLSPTLSLQEAASAVEANIDDLTAALMENGATLDLTTEAGRANAEQIRTSIGGITDFAAAQLTAGVANEEVAATAAAARESLVLQAEGFFTASDAAGTAREQAENYINSLGLTPELINTVFAQPGLMDALLNAEDLTLLYDDAGNPVITEFEAAGIDPAMAEVEGFEGLITAVDGMTADPNISATTAPPSTAEIEEVTTAAETLDGTTASPTIVTPTAPGSHTAIRNLQTDLDKLGRTTASPTVTIPTSTGVNSKIDDLQRDLDKLDRSTATPVITVPSSSGVKQAIDGVQQAADKLDRTTVTPNISVPGAGPAKTAVEALDRAIDGLKDKTVDIRANVHGKDAVDALDRSIDGLRDRTITVTTRNVTVNSMAGRLVTGPTNTNVGERGYAEAIVPLELPLNRVDPSVRSMAALLRGEIGGAPSRGTGTGKVVNNYMTITPNSADPEAVATQIINRSAVMANR